MKMLMIMVYMKIEIYILNLYVRAFAVYSYLNITRTKLSIVREKLYYM